MRSTDSPLVSVCVPTRNRASTLASALASVLAEPLDDLEVVVYDDASYDETAAAVRELDDPRIRYRRQRARVGIARNRNACLDAARGRYLAWLDDDDAYLPGGLSRQVETLEREPSVVLAHGAFDVVDGSDRPQPAWERPFERDTVETGEDAFGELLLSNYIAAPTVVVRSDTQRAAGPYPLDVGDRAEDWDAWLRLSLLGDVAYTARPVATYRCHPGGASHGRSTSLAWLSSEARVVARALRAGGFEPATGRRLARRARAALGIRAIGTGSDALARARPRLAVRALGWAARVVPDCRPHLMAAAGAALDRDEHACHIEASRALRSLARRIADSRLGARVLAQLDATDAWSVERSRVASTIRRVVPVEASVAALDKWDPSLLHEAGRRGRHFPDLALHPRGYPPDDGAAIRHLEELRSRGTDYLVLPRAAWWWLDHYTGFADHLASRHARVWADEACLIYRLEPANGDVRP